MLKSKQESFQICRVYADAKKHRLTRRKKARA